MKEFISNLFKTSNERLKNPLIYSFLISWIAFNWRPIFIVFISKKSIEERISYISANFNEIEFTLFYPLMFSLGYVIILPYVMWLIERVVRIAKIWRKENLVNEKIDDLKGKQRIAVQERVYEQTKAGNAEISELNSKIEELKLSNEQKQKEIESLKIDLTETKKEWNKLEQYINLESPENVEFSDEEKMELDNEYESFLQTEVSTYFERIGTEISQFKSIPQGVDTIIVEKLIYSGLIRKIDNEENQRVYYLLTNKGKYFWKKYVLSKTILTQQELESQDDLPF